MGSFMRSCLVPLRCRLYADAQTMSRYIVNGISINTEIPQMARSGVTLSLLWNEYCEECRRAGEIPLMYTKFCLYYREFALQTKATMHIDRKPGDQMEVDWAGQTAHFVDTDSSEEIPASIFVAVLASSQYAYVEASISQNQECWIAAHVNVYKFFGGVTRMLVPDNLKTGVQKSSWDTPLINMSYQEWNFIEHCNSPDGRTLRHCHYAS